MTAYARELLQVDKLTKHYVSNKGLFSKQPSIVKAVDDVSFSICDGEVLGLVGESGCGKTTLGRLLLRLIEPTGGTVQFDGQQLFDLSKPRLRKKRADMQIVFQDPFGSLNPRMKVHQIIAEPIRIHRTVPKRMIRQKVNELIHIVGLDGYHANKYPHEFSGGQRQRIGIARALALEPKLLICDEPVSALDVSIQSQILNLLQRLQQTYSLTILFISHDLSVVKHISDRIAVMYLGRIVEICDAECLFLDPLHPYTQALLSAILVPDPDAKNQRILLAEDVNEQKCMGCAFCTRCPHKKKICETQQPTLTDMGNNHAVACHLYENTRSKADTS